MAQQQGSNVSLSEVQRDALHLLDVYYIGSNDNGPNPVSKQEIAKMITDKTSLKIIWKSWTRCNWESLLKSTVGGMLLWQLINNHKDKYDEFFVANGDDEKDDIKNNQQEQVGMHQNVINWDDVTQLNLRGGSGGGAGQRKYTVNGINVEATKPVLAFTSNTSYYHMGYMFNGDITTLHPSNQSAGYCGNGHRTTFWLSHCKENDLTFTFTKTLKVSYINVYANIGASWAPPCAYSIDILQNNEWTVFCEMVDTKDDVLSVKRTHNIRKELKGIRFNLMSVGSYVVMKQLDFFVAK